MRSGRTRHFPTPLPSGGWLLAQISPAPRPPPSSEPPSAGREVRDQAPPGRARCLGRPPRRASRPFLPALPSPPPPRRRGAHAPGAQGRGPLLALRRRAWGGSGSAARLVNGRRRKRGSAPPKDSLGWEGCRTDWGCGGRVPGRREVGECPRPGVRSPPLLPAQEPAGSGVPGPTSQPARPPGLEPRRRGWREGLPPPSPAAPFGSGPACPRARGHGFVPQRAEGSRGGY